MAIIVKRDIAQICIEEVCIKINNEIYSSENLSLQSYLRFTNIKISVGKKNVGILKIKN